MSHFVRHDLALMRERAFGGGAAAAKRFSQLMPQRRHSERSEESHPNHNMFFIFHFLNGQPAQPPKHAAAADTDVLSH